MTNDQQKELYEKMLEAVQQGRNFVKASMEYFHLQSQEIEKLKEEITALCGEREFLKERERLVAIGFFAWCDKNRWELENIREANYTLIELFNEFQNSNEYKEMANQPHLHQHKRSNNLS